MSRNYFTPNKLYIFRKIYSKPIQNSFLLENISKIELASDFRVYSKIDFYLKNPTWGVRETPNFFLRMRKSLISIGIAITNKIRPLFPKIYMRLFPPDPLKYPLERRLKFT